MDVILYSGKEHISFSDEETEVVLAGLARNIANHGKDKDGNPARNLHPAIQRRGLGQLKALESTVKLLQAAPMDSMSLHLLSHAIEQCVDDGAVAFDSFGVSQDPEQAELSAVRGLRAEMMLEEPIFADASQPPQHRGEA